ncbi:MAG: Spy/CpxP family protein refolding chaperone [Candidatus Omnitrophica bacterium]|nr:Spy/CpxP family protein refolding chaperone [Candidatus Omnitrophota bacterium]
MKKVFVWMLLMVFTAGPMAYAVGPYLLDDNAVKTKGHETQGQVRDDRRDERFNKQIQDIYNQLALSDEQKTKLEENKKNKQLQRKASFEKMHASMEALNQELMKPDFDMNKINAIQAQIKAVQAQMSDERLNSILEVRRILTVEQFSKFVSLLEKHKSGPPSEERK